MGKVLATQDSQGLSFANLVLLFGQQLLMDQAPRFFARFFRARASAVGQLRSVSGTTATQIFEAITNAAQMGVVAPQASDIRPSNPASRLAFPAPHGALQIYV